MPPGTPFDIHLVSHTHWDREWYLPAGVLRQRLVALIDELLDDPAERARPFLLDGQAVVLDDYLAVRPERREELARRLREGLLEAGPWYVLADELIPSGEGLVRNLLAGRRALSALGAAPPPVLYSPDAFGHPAALPALAAGFGCELVIVWRGLGGEGWPGGDTLRWRAPDGSAALVHHLPPDGYEYGSNLPAEEREARERWARLRDELVPRARTGALLILNGADHHARQERLDEAVEALARAAAPHRVESSTLRRFAERVAADAAGADLPCIAGELRASYGYSWALQGTFAARAALKRWNARVERLLLSEAEPWDALAARSGRGNQRALIETAWRTLLLCHPHDTLCGCSTDEVARAMAARLEDAESQARAITDRAIEGLVGHDAVRARTAPDRWRPVVVVRNATARPRGGLAELEVALFRQTVPVGPGSGAPPHDASPPPNFTLDGGRVPFQILERERRFDRVESPRHYPRNDLVDTARVVAWVPPAPGYGTRTLAIEPDLGDALEHAPAPRVSGSERELAGESLRVRVAADGAPRLEPALPSRDAEPLLGEPLLAFEDVGDAGDLYTHSPIAPRVVATRPVARRLLHAGPLRAELELVYRLEVPEWSSRAGRAAQTRSVDISARLQLDAGAPFLRVQLRGENVARDHRLRVSFATGVKDGAVFADAAFGPALRVPVCVSPEAAAVEAPPPTAPLHRYVTVASASSGATLFSDGLAEYEVSDDGRIAVTLMRAVGELSRNDLPERPGNAGWPVHTPEAQSLGAFEASFALLLHGPRDEESIALVARAADDVLLPLAGDTLRSALALPAPTAGVELEGDGLAFSACKESEDGAWTVLRCVNLLERPVDGRWRLGAPATEAALARLDETILAPLAVHDGAIAFTAAPRAVVTILAR
ncbi:MAG TPA: glycoside hydrolase family 38 C-terminal domain-containing protein [Gemmatimonadaceae bacterium]|nr:glycoside hydrolase family 38 C-terminal domain-containing protein [Gemmatimonadaceae bacterium]